MNNELPLFDTCKELNKYLPMETEFYWYEFGNGERKIIPRLPENNIDYPAPLLSELWDNSDYDLRKEIIYKMRCYITATTANITEQVAQTILQYYRSKEK